MKDKLIRAWKKTAKELTAITLFLLFIVCSIGTLIALGWYVIIPIVKSLVYYFVILPVSLFLVWLLLQCFLFTINFIGEMMPKDKEDSDVQNP